MRCSTAAACSQPRARSPGLPGRPVARNVEDVSASLTRSSREIWDRMRASASARSNPRCDSRRSRATSVGGSTTTTLCNLTVSRCRAVRRNGQDHDVVGVGQRVPLLNHGDADGRVGDGVEREPALLVCEATAANALRSMVPSAWRISVPKRSIRGW